MATQTSGSDFTNNLGRVYGLYTGGFIAFVVVVAILEKLGVPNRILGYLFLVFTIGIYALIGIISRTMQVSEYYVAGRRVPAFYNGMATGADWMSAASFIGMAGTLYFQGYNGLAFVLGWTGGYVLVATLIAPFLRKFGAYTVPDFLAARYGGNVARFLGVIVLITCSFTYVVAQIDGTGKIASRFLGLDFNLAVFVGLAGILVCSMLGGMRAVTWTQVAQYIVLIIAYLIPVVLLSAQRYGVPVPQLMYGQALQEIAAREGQMIQQGLAVAGGFRPHLQTFANDTAFINFFALILCLMVGTASLPHVLMRYFTTPSVREARISVAWSLLFIFLLYFTAPAYAAFAKLEVYQNVIGKSLAELPRWIYVWGSSTDLVRVCGAAPVDPAAVAAACGKIAGHPGVLRLQDLFIHTDAIVISTPEIAGLPYVIAGLVAAGGLAAALSTADGLLLAIANALSHDIYYKMIDQNAPTARRLVVSRVLLVLVAIAAAYVASLQLGDILAFVSWAFSLAAGGLFPALVLGVWWRRMNSAGAIAAIVVGFGVTLTYILVTRFYWETGLNVLGMSPFAGITPQAVANTVVAAIQKVAGFSADAPAWKTFAATVLGPDGKALPTLTFNQLGQAVAALPADLAAAGKAAMQTNAAATPALGNRIGWFGIGNLSAAIFGLPAGFLAAVVASLLTPAPSREIQSFIDEVRKPRGKTIMEEKAA